MTKPTDEQDFATDTIRAAPSTRWLIAVAAVPPAVAVLATTLAPDPHGHWTEHLASSALKSTQLVVLLVLITMLGWRKLSPLLLAAFAVLGVGIVLQTLGDYQVADSIWRTRGDPGFGDGYTQGHDNSAFGDLLVMVGGLSFAIVAGIRRRASVRLAVLAGFMVIIPPPFLWPAAGVLLLVLKWLTTEQSPRTGTAAT